MSDPSEQDDAPIIHVECYAGHSADTEPRRLHIVGRAVTVMQIIDRWLDPRHRYFKLRGDDGSIYLIRHDTASDRWDLTLFDSGRHDAARLSST